MSVNPTDFIELKKRMERINLICIYVWRVHKPIFTFSFLKVVFIYLLVGWLVVSVLFFQQKILKKSKWKRFLHKSDKVLRSYWWRKEKYEEQIWIFLFIQKLARKYTGKCISFTIIILICTLPYTLLEHVISWTVQFGGK